MIDLIVFLLCLSAFCFIVAYYLKTNRPNNHSDTRKALVIAEEYKRLLDEALKHNKELIQRLEPEKINSPLHCSPEDKGEEMIKQIRQINMPFFFESGGGSRNPIFWDTCEKHAFLLGKDVLHKIKEMKGAKETIEYWENVIHYLDGRWNSPDRGKEEAHGKL